MNNGFFGFPSSTDTNIISVKEYDTSGTYAIPSNAKRIMIFAVGGGGGGGGGVRRVATSGSAGGAGGNAGCYVLTELPIKAFANIKTLSIIIGAGGVGGIGATADSASPAASTPGGNTEVRVPGKNAPILMAGGNVGGGGGLGTGLSSNPVSATSVGISILFGHPFGQVSDRVDSLGLSPMGSGYPIVSYALDKIGGAGGYSSGTSGTNSGVTGGSIRLISCFECGGAGGGSLHSNTAAGAGGSITALRSTDLIAAERYYSTFTSTNFDAGSTYCAGGLPNGGTAGESGNTLINPDAMFSSGVGGAGGGGGATGAGNRAGNGGNGYRGGGGGGGGGSANGVSAGNGGNGGNGYVKILAIG